MAKVRKVLYKKQKGFLHKKGRLKRKWRKSKGRGNSSWQQRAKLIDRFISLLGENSISYLVADREFIGSQWMSYLRSKNSSGAIKASLLIHILKIKQFLLIRAKR